MTDRAALFKETYTRYGVSETAASRGAAVDIALDGEYNRIDSIVTYNELKVLDAFRKEKFSDVHLGLTTGYGYDDIGREKIEAVFARVFGAESAYVRYQISSGTQSISAMLWGALRPGDTLLSVTGKPYDTLASTIGISSDDKDNDMSLVRFGVLYEQIELLPDGKFDFDKILDRVKTLKGVVFIQKSRGYTDRAALLCEDIGELARRVREINPDVIIAVDNCYGEFCERYEPTELGADVCAGSLIKNPGGGICKTGGYIVGRSDLTENAARHLTAPGLGSEVGPTLGFNRDIAMGLFVAPRQVGECLKGAVFAAKFFEESGYKTSPKSDEVRGDIVQTLIFEDEEKMKDFVGKIQMVSPVDSFVTPEPWDMPGYEDQVVMAAGTFVQGATTELSCDGPIKPPYIAYLQGGLVSQQIKLASMAALS
ncbi:MAG: methionine gamma-lyase family protein [Clostridiales bacterium]|nr:methionine gamma-lyase family protein [Clostridiales bacterium]